MLILLRTAHQKAVLLLIFSKDHVRNSQELIRYISQLLLNL